MNSKYQLVSEIISIQEGILKTLAKPGRNVYAGILKSMKRNAPSPASWAQARQKLMAAKA